MGALYYNGSKLKKVYYNNNQIKKLYYNNNLIFSNNNWNLELTIESISSDTSCQSYLHPDKVQIALGRSDDKTGMYISSVGERVYTSDTSYYKNTYWYKFSDKSLYISRSTGDEDVINNYGITRGGYEFSGDKVISRCWMSGGTIFHDYFYPMVNEGKYEMYSKSSISKLLNIASGYAVSWISRYYQKDITSITNDYYYYIFCKSVDHNSNYGKKILKASNRFKTDFGQLNTLDNNAGTIIDTDDCYLYWNKNCVRFQAGEQLTDDKERKLILSTVTGGLNIPKYIIGVKCNNLYYLIPRNRKDFSSYSSLVSSSPDKNFTNIDLNLPVHDYYCGIEYINNKLYLACTNNNDNNIYLYSTDVENITT